MHWKQHQGHAVANGSLWGYLRSFCPLCWNAGSCLVYLNESQQRALTESTSSHCTADFIISSVHMVMIAAFWEEIWGRLFLPLFPTTSKHKNFGFLISFLPVRRKMHIKVEIRRDISLADTQSCPFLSFCVFCRGWKMLQPFQYNQRFLPLKKYLGLLAIGAPSCDERNAGLAGIRELNIRRGLKPLESQCSLIPPACFHFKCGDLGVLSNDRNPLVKSKKSKEVPPNGQNDAVSGAELFGLPGRQKKPHSLMSKMLLFTCLVAPGPLSVCKGGLGFGLYAAEPKARSPPSGLVGQCVCHH